MGKKAKVFVVVLAAVMAIVAMIWHAPIASASEFCYVNDCQINNQNCHCCVAVEAGFSCYAHCGQVSDCKPVI